MELDIYQVDAFTNDLFKGNPAAVVPLDAPLAEDLMQAIAAENNLAETAFFYPIEGGYFIRWFTPSAEVPLCGHATLASASVVFDFLARDAETVRFDSASGWLTVRKLNGALELDFPTISHTPVDFPNILNESFGFSGDQILQVFETSGDPNYMIVLDSEASVRAAQPDLALLKTLSQAGVIITARSDQDGVDFCSRYFAPSMGIDEDPVTGSIHCALTPYWAEQVDETCLQAVQLSKREGRLSCEVSGDRVLIRGQAKLYMRGQIYTL